MPIDFPDISTSLAVSTCVMIPQTVEQRAMILAETQRDCDMAMGQVCHLDVKRDADGNLIAISFKNMSVKFCTDVDGIARLKAQDEGR